MYCKYLIDMHIWMQGADKQRIPQTRRDLASQGDEQSYILKHVDPIIQAPGRRSYIHKKGE